MKPGHRRFLWGGLAGLVLGLSVATLHALPLSFLPLPWVSVSSPRGADEAGAPPIDHTQAYQDPRRFQAAWALPVAALYHADIAFQRNASFCGPASLVNVLHSWQLPGEQEGILSGTGVSTILGFLPGGISLDELAEIARRKLGRRVTVLRDLDLAGFREQLRHANDLSRRYVVNFSRAPLFGSGGGHHSPIAGYLEDADLVLVLDVNRNYGPWLVRSERLFDAMDTVDWATGRKRGLLLIE